MIVGIHFQAHSFVFQLSTIQSQRSAMIVMKGRSLEERKFSKKQLFRQVREHLREFSKAPGFFDTEEDKIEVELICESTKDGRQVSDCPYTQFVQMIMVRKGIAYKRSLVTRNSEEWNEYHEAEYQLPVLIHANNTISDPMEIAEYLEETFPEVCLTRPGIFMYDDILETIQDFFPTLTTYITNKDPNLETEYAKLFQEQLDLLEDILRSSPGKYLCGIELTLADLYILPQLFHAIATNIHFKKLEIYTCAINPERPALEKYIKHMLKLKEFKAHNVFTSIDKIVHTWKIRKGWLSY